MDPRVRTALALMQENLQGAWSPDKLARAVNLSPSRFQHLFKAEVGMAPAHYLRALRLEQARKLLQTSRLTVKQIMNEVGVEDKSHFAREFKKAYGLTPTAYRAAHLLAGEVKASTRPDSRDGQQIAELASIFMLSCETYRSISCDPERAGNTPTSRSRSRSAEVDPRRIIDPEDHMYKSNLATAEAYYSALESGDYEKIGSYLHKDVKYSDPRWPLTGKDRVWPIAKSFSDAVKQLKTVGKFSTNDQVMLVHDVIFYGSEKPLRTAVSMTFDEGLIKEIGLISDISQHMDVCTEIFSDKNKSNLATAEAYYSALESGDYEKIGSYLHKDVKYSDPRWPLTGKDRVWPIAKSFSDAVKQLKTVGKFSTNDQVMLVQDVIFHGSEKPLRTAVLMTFDEGLIKEIGLISDISQHMDVCTEIFSDKNQSNLATAEAYYSALESGDYEKIGSYLHEDVKYSDPRWPLTGKDRVWPIAKSFSNAVKQLKTVGKFSTNDQVMLVHDVIFHKSKKPLRTAVSMTFDEGLIKEIGLISDISQHMDVCTEIFSYPSKP